MKTEKWTKADIKKQFAYCNVDIMYRKLVKGRWGGWRSFKKSVKTVNPPWPW